MENKVAWITGGGSGIGLAGAIELQKAGAKVVISGRSEATLKEAMQRVKAEAIALDVGDKAQVARVAADIQKRHGRIDILVNSAGINLPQRNFRNVSAEGWDQIVAINLSGMFYCVHAVLPGMRERKDGLIINVSSWAGRYASTLTGPGYNATKHAVIALTESINLEECANGIRATSILPGEAATPILEKRPVPPTPEVRAKMLQPEDLGRTILFIATLPARACVNEIIVTPTWNRFLLGGLETPKN
ncbi:MAG TPA: SDR family oxidoreductase [Burkholderiales bacterium]|nr:SDR family oxidoreductase [Burkholderiales bacterium]